MFKVKQIIQKWQLAKEYCVACSTMIGMASGQPSSARTFFRKVREGYYTIKMRGTLC